MTSLVVDPFDVDVAIMSIEYSMPHRTGSWHTRRIITVIEWVVNRGAILRDSQNFGRIEMVDELGAIRMVSICSNPRKRNSHKVSTSNDILTRGSKLTGK